MGISMKRVVAVCSALIAMVYFAGVYGPIFHNYQAAPKDVYYFGTDGYPLDTLGSLDLVRQGYNGQWTAHMRYTSVWEFPKTFVKFDYILVGHVARWLEIDPVTALHVSRIVTSIAFLVCLYYVIRYVTPDPMTRIVAFLLVVFTTSFPFPGHNSSFTMIATSVFYRFGLYPQHYIGSGLCTIISLYFLSRAAESAGNWILLGLASVFGALGAFLFGPNLLLVVGALALYFMIFLVWKPLRVSLKGKHIPFVWMVSMFVYYAISIAIPLVYINIHWLSQGGPDGGMEYLNPFWIPVFHFVAAVGLVYPLAFFAIPTLVKNRNKLLILFALWLIVMPVSVYVLPAMVGLNQYRFFLTPYTVPFGILAAIGIAEISRWIHGRLSIVPRAIVSLVLVSFVIAASLSIYKKSFIVDCFCTVPAFSHPSSDLIAATGWLKEHTQPHDIVLSGLVNGVFIPAFAGNDIYMNWWLYLSGRPNSSVIIATADTFYQGRMTPQEAYAFVRDYHIAYVLVGADEPKNLPYTILVEVFRSGSTVIYKVAL